MLTLLQICLFCYKKDFILYLSDNNQADVFCSTVSLLLSNWYPGSGVVLGCIDSKSLHPYLLFFCNNAYQNLYIMAIKRTVGKPNFVNN